MKETKEERTTLLDVMAKDNLIRDSLKRTFKYVKEKTKRPKYTKLGLPKMKIVI